MEPIKVIRNEQYLAAAQGILGLSRYSVDLCTYKFEITQRADARDLNSLIATLYSLVVIGVRIRVLLNITGKRSGLSRLNENTGKALKTHGIEVRYLPDNRCQHAKMLLVDRCMGIIGSHNWSPKSMTDNFEVSVEIHHAGYLQEIQAHFEKIWEGSKEL